MAETLTANPYTQDTEEVAAQSEVALLENGKEEEGEEGSITEIRKNRKTLAEKLLSDEDDKIFNRYVHKLYKSTGLSPETFQEKTDNLMNSVKNGTYPITAQKAAKKIKIELDAFEKLASIYGDDAEALRDFHKKSREEKQAILYGHAI